MNSPLPTTRPLSVAVLLAITCGAGILFFPSRDRSIEDAAATTPTAMRQPSHPIRAALQVQPVAPQKYTNGSTRINPPAGGGLTEDDWQAIRTQIEESEYAFELGNNRAETANRKQRIKASVSQAGIEVTPYAQVGTEPAWRWSLRLKNNLGGDSAEVTASGRRAEVKRGGFTEWYKNQSVGVEQGFTIEETVIGDTAADGRLQLEFECETSLTPEPLSATGLVWKDDAGAVALRYTGLYAYDANAQRVPAEFEISPESPELVTIALNTEGATFPLTVDPLIATLENGLTATNPVSEPQFGFAVAMQGDVCAIASPPDDPEKINPATGAGYVYIFVRTPSGVWVQANRLNDPLLNSHRAFGSAVALDGHRLLVGAAAFADPGTPAPASAIGAYIFEFEPGSRFQTITRRTDLPDPAGPSRASGYGLSVAISDTGEYVAVGSPTASLGGSQTGGRVLVYRRKTDGSYETTATPNHDRWGGQFMAEWGRSLCFDRAGGSKLAIGAPGMTQSGFVDAGRVEVLVVSQAGTLASLVTPAGSSYLPGGRFGSSVSLYGSTLAVGHPGVTVPFIQSDGSTIVRTLAGAVHLFGSHAGVWFESDVILAPDQFTNAFGARLSLDSEILVVDSDTRSHGYSCEGSEWVSTFSYPDFQIFPDPTRPLAVSGNHVLFGDTGEIYQLQGNGWSQIESGLTTATPGERLGTSLAGTRDFTVVGSPFYSTGGNTNRGLVSVVTYFESGRPIISPLGTGAPGGAELGTTVATDGRTIVAGAPGFDSGVGLVSIYERDGSGNWGEVGVVTNPDGLSTAGDRFGSAIAIDGDHLVVGAPLDPVTGFWVGRAWVFQRDSTTGQWTNPQLLVPVGGLGDFDLFGWAVDIEGDRIIVGEPGDDTAGSGTGAVHVFEKRSGVWEWRAKMTQTASEIPVGVEVNLGFSVALDGDMIAAGAPAPVISPGSGPGSVSVFARMAGGTDHWGQITRILPGDSANDDEFGFSVQWHDDELFVGTGLTETIYVLRSGNGGSRWSENSRLVNPLEAVNSGYGHSFAITRNTLATGIPLAHSGAGELVYFRRPRGWYPAPVYDDVQTNGFGSALAIDGDTAVIGADRYTVPSAPGAEHGGVYVLNRGPGGAWSAEANVLTADPATAGARFGAAVAIDRDHLIVGAPLHTGTGAAWEFTRQHDGLWFRKAIPGGGGQFGTSVSLDGRLAVIGAPFSGTHGSAFVYQFDIGSFGAVLEKTILPPTLPVQSPGSADVRFGASVSIDTATIAIGAPGVDLATGVDRGAAYVYERYRNGPMQWGLAKALDGFPSQAPAQFGESLVLAGNWLLIGAPGHDAGPFLATGATGAAHLFRYGNGGPGNWGREQILVPSELQPGERFGHAVAMGDEWIAVGAPGRKLPAGTQTGAVETFLLTGAGANPAKYAMRLDSPSFTAFGSSIALGGSTLLVGDDRFGPTSSAVLIFSLMSHRERWGFDMFGSDVFDPLLESTTWGDAADQDRDGRSTSLEYLMGSNPADNDRAPSETSLVTATTPGARTLRLRFRKARLPIGSEYQLEPQWSPDLKTWYPSGAGPSPAEEKDIWQVVVSNDESWDSWLVDAFLDIGPGDPRAYLRLFAKKLQ